MYKHREDSTYMTAHDCFAETFRMDGRDLVLEFPHGIWVGAEHPHNPHGRPVGTDAACLRFTEVAAEEDEVFDCCELHLMGKLRLGRRRTRSLYEIKEILIFLQKKHARLEILDVYTNDSLPMIHGFLHLSPRKTVECFWIIEAKSVQYLWNDLSPDRAW